MRVYVQALERVDEVERMMSGAELYVVFVVGDLNED